MSNYLKKSKGEIAFSIFNYTFLALTAFLCILPMVNVLAISLSSSHAANANLVKLWPVQFTIQSYKLIFSRNEIINSFLFTVERTALGVILNNALTILMAYPLSKPKRKFRGRDLYMWGMIFVLLFNGGLVPTYMLVKELHLIDTVWSLVLPGAVPIFSVILMMNFFRQLPGEIEEAAFIDGASYIKSLIQIILPLSMPVIATVTLFHFVGHWNEWFSGLIYINDINKYPLQTMLQTIISGSDIKSLDDARTFNNVSDRTLKAAQIFVTTLPILILYPFLQKYFAKGIVIGSIKG